MRPESSLNFSLTAGFRVPARAKLASVNLLEPHHANSLSEEHQNPVTSETRPEKIWLWRLAEFIKFPHTLFALPFALISTLVAGQGQVPPRVLGWILVCMVAARTAAMAFNRLVDWEIDKQNPRTAQRHLLIKKPHGWMLLVVALLLFLFGTWSLNRFCFYLSPFLITVLLGYSLTKRFTAFSHAFLGLALALAPIGAWAAVCGELRAASPFVLAGAVLCWVFGFDLIYATMDIAFDRAKKLFSFPAIFGLAASLRLARILHAVATAGFCLFGWWAPLGWPYGIACAVSAIALVWEHHIANPKDLALINRAFFHINAMVSLLLLLGAGLSYLV